MNGKYMSLKSSKSSRHKSGDKHRHSSSSDKHKHSSRDVYCIYIYIVKMANQMTKWKAVL